MGLASKLAATQGGIAAVSNYTSAQTQQSAPGAQQGGYPGRPTYQSQGPPPPQSGYGGAPQGFPGAPPSGQYQQQNQQSYGAPQYGGPPSMSASSPQDIQSYENQLRKAIQEKHLKGFYSDSDPRIRQAANRAAQAVDRLCQAWRIPRELAQDIVRLALYDVVIYVDDSGSMSFEENGERIKDLKLILERVAFAATLFDDDGVDLVFMNDEEIPQDRLSGIRNEQQIEYILQSKKFKGLTPFGTKLRSKVIDRLVLPKLRNNRGAKPVLIIGITDGQPAGESADALHTTVQYAINTARSFGGVGGPEGQQLGENAIAFEFAQVGNDQKATEFLAKLDNDAQVGRMVDCTSNYENESAEMARAQPPVDLTPDLWVLKLILGAIDPSYDTKDEKGGMSGPSSQYGAPQPGYGGPPQGYGGPPSGYGAPPQGQYGQPGGYPGQQSGYPGQQSGYPGQQQSYQSQQGYGQPQGRYNQSNYDQQGGYNRPPPPPGQSGYQPQGGYGAGYR